MITSTIDRTRNIESINNMIRGKKVLEIGCGFHSLAFDHKLAKEFWGIDTSLQAIQFRQMHDTGKFIYTDKVPENHFDIIIIGYALHHIPKERHEQYITDSLSHADQVIIIDHYLSENPVIRSLQKLYFRIFDNGKKYYRKPEWHELFDLTNAKLLSNDNYLQSVVFKLERGGKICKNLNDCH